MYSCSWAILDIERVLTLSARYVVHEGSYLKKCFGGLGGEGMQGDSAGSCQAISAIFVLTRCVLGL